ncbi:hypothetical protein J7I91_16275 [Pseudomonas sp. ISL-84]|nr:hypothetical protein [Pseudomonas sp. ISL-84]
MVLGNIQVQTLIESEYKLPSYAADIKEIRKNVHLTQCEVLPITNVNDMASLFIEGYIHKNIQYVEGCEGYVRDYSVNVPFNCYSRVQLARPILFPFGQYSRKNNDLETRVLAEDGQGADRCTFGSSTFEINNEPIHCKLVASSVNQWDVLQNFDNCGRFDTVSEKEDITLTVRLTQIGSGCEPS